MLTHRLSILIDRVSLALGGNFDTCNLKLLWIQQYYLVNAYNHKHSFETNRCCLGTWLHIQISNWVSAVLQNTNFKQAFTSCSAAWIAEEKGAILYNRISFWLLCNIIPLDLECGILCMTGSWTELRTRSWFKIIVRVTKWCCNPVVTTLLFSTK